MSVNKYVNGKLLQMSGNADTRLTKDDINTILGYTPADSSVCEETFKKYVQLDGGDTADGITTFTSNDTSESSSWTDVDVMNSGEKHSSLFSKISTMFKNIRYLYKLLGTTDISTIGDGTVRGAISSLNSNLNNFSAIVDIAHEDLTCQAEVIRDYIFPDLPTHTFSIPIIYGASIDMSKTIVYRDTNVTGRVLVYSPIEQEVSVILVLFK